MLFVCHKTVSIAAVYQLMIKYDQDKLQIQSSVLDASDTTRSVVSSPLEWYFFLNGMV